MNQNLRAQTQQSLMRNFQSPLRTLFALMDPQTSEDLYDLPILFQDQQVLHQSMIYKSCPAPNTGPHYQSFIIAFFFSSSRRSQVINQLSWREKRNEAPFSSYSQLRYCYFFQVQGVNPPYIFLLAETAMSIVFMRLSHFSWNRAALNLCSEALNIFSTSGVEFNLSFSFTTFRILLIRTIV